MVRVRAAVSHIALFLGIAYAGFGAHWALNPHTNKSFQILRAVTTLEVPQLPSPQVDTLFLWPGMNTDGRGLVQSVLASNHPGAAQPYGCNAQAGQWCVLSYLLLQGKGSHSKPATVSPGDYLTIDYQYEQATGSYMQTVTRDGEVLTSFNRDSGGHAANFYIEVECHNRAIGATPAHTYYNTTITMASEYPEFGGTLNTNHSTNSDLSSPDKGKTWTVATINIEAFECYPNRSDISAAGGSSDLTNSTNPDNASSTAAATTSASTSASSSASSASATAHSMASAPESYLTASWLGWIGILPVLIGIYI